MTLQNPFVAGFRNLMARRLLPLPWVQRKLGRGVGMLDLVTTQSHTLLSTGLHRKLVGRRLPNPQWDGKWLHEWLHREQHSLLYIRRQGGDWDKAFSVEGLATVPLSAEFLKENVEGLALELQSIFRDGKMVVVRPDRVVVGVVRSVDELERKAEQTLGFGAASPQPS